MEELIDFLKGEIGIIPNSEFLELLPEAEDLLRSHEKDAPYLALALAFKCEIFSGDKRFKELSPVAVYSPRELFEMLVGKRI